jgi:hypothetical protein
MSQKEYLVKGTNEPLKLCPFLEKAGFYMTQLVTLSDGLGTHTRTAYADCLLAAGYSRTGCTVPSF